MTNLDPGSLSRELISLTVPTRAFRGQSGAGNPQLRKPPGAVEGSNRLMSSRREPPPSELAVIAVVSCQPAARADAGSRRQIQVNVHGRPRGGFEDRVSDLQQCARLSAIIEIQTSGSTDVRSLLQIAE